MTEVTCGESTEVSTYTDGLEGTGSTSEEERYKLLLDHLEFGLSTEDTTSTTEEELMEIQTRPDRAYVYFLQFNRTCWKLRTLLRP